MLPIKTALLIRILCIRIQHPCDFRLAMNGLLLALFRRSMRKKTINKSKIKTHEFHYVSSGIDVANQGGEEQWGPEHPRHHAECRHHPRD
jgi:hypothetical protein